MLFLMSGSSVTERVIRLLDLNHLLMRDLPKFLSEMRYAVGVVILGELLVSPVDLLLGGAG